MVGVNVELELDLKVEFEEAEEVEFMGDEFEPKFEPAAETDTNAERELGSRDWRCELEGWRGRRIGRGASVGEAVAIGVAIILDDVGADDDNDNAADCWCC